MIISSIPSIIFGFLFGEFLGNLGEMMGWIQPVYLLGISWNRAKAIIPMLILAISVGVAHFFLGLFRGMRNAIILKSRMHFAERTGMILMISGIIVLLVTFAGVVPESTVYVAVILMLIGLPLILYGAGAFGTIEVMCTVGNILSYPRLMAFGIAIIGIIVAVLLHTLNVVLAMFSPSIHSIRLHLVEFSRSSTRAGVWRTSRLPGLRERRKGSEGGGQKGIPPLLFRNGVTSAFPVSD
jgi:V/A-type H+-transporting ATPase subunit I